MVNVTGEREDLAGGPGQAGYNVPYRRQKPPVPAPPPDFTMLTPPTEEPGSPPAGTPPGPAEPRPPMPSVAPPTTATPVSAGSFLRPGMNMTALAPFRTAPTLTRPAATPAFGPGTPLAGGAVTPDTFGGGDQGAPPTPEELLRMLQGG